MPRTVNSSSLEDRARKIVETLGGNWTRKRGMCCCPAHADRTPSLSVTLGRRAVLFHCFAGCSNTAVIEALISSQSLLTWLFEMPSMGDPFAGRWSPPLQLVTAGSPVGKRFCGAAIALLTRGKERSLSQEVQV